MNTLYIIVISIALAFLVVCLVVFGMIISFQKRNYSFPNTQPAACPDKWPEYKGRCHYIGQGVNFEEQLITTMGQSTPTEFMAMKTMLDRPDLASNNGNLLTTTDLEFSNTNLFDLNTNDYTLKFNDDITLCEKRRWANLNGIKWDGVSNYNDCGTD